MRTWKCTVRPKAAPKITTWPSWKPDTAEELKNLLKKVENEKVREISAQIKELGRDIVGMDADKKYGSGFYKCLSNDLKEELPGVDGLSPSNLRYTKRFYLLYNELVGNFQQLAENSDERLKSVRSSCPRQ